MAAPSHVFTLSRVANVLGADEELSRELAMGMEPEDGCLSYWVRTTTTQSSPSRPSGVENLKELLEDLKERG